MMEIAVPAEPNMKRLAVYRALGLTLALVFLTSCAVSYRTAVDSLIGSTPCCKSFAEFRYDQLPSGEATTFNLDINSDSFVFSSGKSYFKAFNLGKRQTPYYIHVKSLALGESPHIFFPQLALLDDGFAVLGESDPSAFRLTGTAVFETWGKPFKIEGLLVVDEPNARYLVIYTTKQLMAMTSEDVVRETLPVPIQIPGGVLIGAVPSFMTPIAIPHSPFGRISIKVIEINEATH